jgi:tetratricopeptide (TPR) repeat protein
MIVRDEETTLPGALEDAAHFCDELVIVDTGSTDRTVEVARSFGAQVFHFDWIDDFAAARNYSFEQCSGKWTLWLDADDRIAPASWSGLRAVIDELPRLVDVDSIVLPYRYRYAEADSNVCLYCVHRSRLIRHSPDLRWKSRIHETIPIAAARTMRRADAWIEHRPPHGHLAASVQRNLPIIERCLEDGDRSPRMLDYYARNLADVGRHEEALAVYEELCSLPLDSKPSSLRVRGRTLILMAKSAAALDMAEKELELLGRAIALDSEHAEAFIILGQHFCDQRDFKRAIPFFRAAATLKAPVDEDHNPSCYTWLPWDYLAICASELGDFKAALEYSVRALPGHPEKDRLVANMRLYVGHL